jgi:GNAT superfamily N-acetyltransferase
MDPKYILALYDQDRKGISLFGMQREETSHLVRHISPSGEGIIIYSNLNSTNVEEVIQEQIAHFESRGRDFGWVVFRHDTPASLKDRLLAHGFLSEEPDAIMILDIEDLSPVLVKPSCYDVQRISDPDKIDDVLTIRQQVWQSDYSSMAQSLTKQLVDAPESLVLYVAYVDGKPVSTAQISFYQKGHFAGLVQAATLPDYRGRGLYTALVAMRVQEARRRGIRFIDADASPMSRTILEKLGFQWLTEANSCDWHVKQVSTG